MRRPPPELGRLPVIPAARSPLAFAVDVTATALRGAAESGPAVFVKPPRRTGRDFMPCNFRPSASGVSHLAPSIDSNRTTRTCVSYSSHGTGTAVRLKDRTKELDILDSACAEALSGRTRTVLLEGAAGCGKTAILAVAAERAAAQAVVLRAEGTEAESGRPLGVLRQLLDNTPAGYGRPELPDPEDGPPRAESMRKFCTWLRDFAAATPAVCFIDDLHHADELSLQYLRYFIRHVRTERILLVATATPHHGSANSSLQSELLHSPSFQRVRLRRLSRLGVAQVLDAEPELPRHYHHLVEDLHNVSGGNPLLVRALLEDWRAVWPEVSEPRPLQPVTGGLFAHAVDTCLRRSGRAAREVAAAFSILGSLGTPERAAELHGTTVSAAARGMAALTDAGILDGCGFRHPAARTAVLNELTSAQQAGLHRRVARLLHDTGQHTKAVTGHLLASAQADIPWSETPWAADLLRNRAEQLLARDEPRQAAAALELALEACADARIRVDITTRLATVLWRFDPRGAEGLLTAPLDNRRADTLTGPQLGAVAHVLAYQGRVAEAARINDHIAGTANATDDTGLHLPELSGSRVLTSYWDVPDATDRSAATAAERVLEQAVLTDTTVHALNQAIRSLSHSPQPERAAHWSQRLADEAERRGAPGWQALFATLHAEVLLRLGDLRGAELRASAALDVLPEPTAGSFASAPMAVLIRTHTMTGEHAAAADRLNRPAEDQLFDSIHGPGYLRARGLYYLATDQLHLALSDFTEAGRLLKRWDLDRPVVLPWRTDAAEALLRAGESQQAERLIHHQLASPDARHPWVRGISLRMRAKTAPQGERPALLGQAIEELRRSGDRIELAGALADLGRTLQSLGENSRGNTVTRRAWNLAHACGAKPLCEETIPGRAPRDLTRERTLIPADTAIDSKLSSSEQRVAALAAHGYTNREISLRLYITVSTVEQHLTKVYRKLKITRRQDLPMDLPLASVEAP
ncbi:AAA family ATPase [Streptomyces sp. NPDC088747]|uniref:helix-turn-helix transcriptional regulator n=1 Tax=Streptomyces sp. NPDC088747 TaxID=3365886 RepID=UPI0038221F7C